MWYSRTGKGGSIICGTAGQATGGSIMFSTAEQATGGSVKFGTAGHVRGGSIMFGIAGQVAVYCVVQQDRWQYIVWYSRTGDSIMCCTFGQVEV